MNATGIRFPLAVTDDGRLATSSGVRDIEEAIRIVLRTVRGERLGEPRFGTRLADHVFGNMNAHTLGAIQAEIHEALRTWEPRIEVDSVRLDPVDGGLEGRLDIEVRYRLRGAATVHRLAVSGGGGDVF